MDATRAAAAVPARRPALRDGALQAGQRIRARRFVVATGSAAAVPPVPGLGNIPYLSNETIFGLTERPGHLLVLGGGAIGVEMAQAFRRLGAAVTLVERGAIAALLAPYPTMSEISKRAAGSFYTPTLFGPRTRRLVGLVQRLLP